MISLFTFESDARASRFERQYRFTRMAHPLRENANGTTPLQKLEACFECQLVLANVTRTILSTINGQDSTCG
jgi:hypothetical protein